jgi:two-component system cell cycle sensor histidine kinase/response regulator CckA
VFWPRCSEAPDAARPGGTPFPRSAARRCSVLVVEDDDAVRRFAVRGLERAGCDVLSAADGLEAARLSDAHEGQFDVLVVDVVLPRGRGADAVARLRARQPTARVLFISGYRTDPATLPAGPGGPASFLQKPFTAAALVERVRDLAEGAHA